jgi:putative endonuclease
MFYAYVLRSQKDNTLYYGSSNNPVKRLKEEHNRGKVKYTKSRMPWSLVYMEEFVTRAEALKREKFFKTGFGRNLIQSKLNI